MNLRPTRDTYHVERLPSPERRGSIFLPDGSRERFYDAEVLAAGPGRYEQDARWVPMQARARWTDEDGTVYPGDRIICDPTHFEHYGGARTGFVSDRHLLGIIRAPHHRGVEPAGAWLLIDPDPRPDYRRSDGGVLIAQNRPGTLAGAEEREKQRGFELVRIYGELLNSPRYREQPTDWDRWRLEKGWFESLTPWDRQCMSPALQKQRELHAQKRPRNPTLLLEERDYVARAPVKLNERILTGRVLGIGPDARTEARLGEHVRWRRYHDNVRILVGDKLRLLIEARDLEAVMESDPAPEQVESVRRLVEAVEPLEVAA